MDFLTVSRCKLIWAAVNPKIMNPMKAENTSLHHESSRDRNRNHSVINHTTTEHWKSHMSLLYYPCAIWILTYAVQLLWHKSSDEGWWKHFDYLPNLKQAVSHDSKEDFIFNSAQVGVELNTSYKSNVGMERLTITTKKLQLNFSLVWMERGRAYLPLAPAQFNPCAW